mmetsp:Transcript_19614/g.45634  ORF Transcript_19614/g.45634 Transcript_19614/m.45634 type:complete len:215 (-) Transcript_19614:1288-1932(-)
MDTDTAVPTPAAVARCENAARRGIVDADPEDATGGRRSSEYRSLPWFGERSASDKAGGVRVVSVSVAVSVAVAVAGNRIDNDQDAHRFDGRGVVAGGERDSTASKKHESMPRATMHRRNRDDDLAGSLLLPKGTRCCSRIAGIAILSVVEFFIILSFLVVVAGAGRAIFLRNSSFTNPIDQLDGLLLIPGWVASPLVVAVLQNNDSVVLSEPFL